MYIMYDSVDLTQIPLTAQAVAGYVGGEWPTDSHDALRAKFPRAFVVSIAVNAAQKASFLDVENGDATVDDARGWLEARLAEGQVRPGLYGSQSTMGQLTGRYQGDKNAVLHGIMRSKYRLWVAAPNGLASAEQFLTDGYGACQFDWHYLGRDLDASLCKPGFFTVVERPKVLEAA